MAVQIYIIEKCQELANLLEVSFKQEGFEVTLDSDATSSLKLIEESHPDIILFDTVLADSDGFDLVRDIRRITEIPILIMSSKHEEMDELLALKLGADDFLKKPVSIPVLIQRCKNILNRMSQHQQHKENGKGLETIYYGKFKLDPEKFSCSWDGKIIDLTITEFNIIHSLLRRPGFVKTRDQLLDAAYGEKIYVDDRTIDTHIKHIRKKIKSLDKSFSEIETVYGLGYRIKDKNNSK